MSTDPAQTPDSSGRPPPGGLDNTRLNSALKAFKKRLKLARLDDESRLGHGAMSGGGKSGIVAITPPSKYPPAIWEELVLQGKLRKAGHGMYELADEL